MTEVSLEQLADVFFPPDERGDSTVYGTVSAVNQDGSYQVRLNASSTTTRCTRLCSASVGDRVLVLMQANGRCAAIGRVGGDGIAPTVLYDNPSGSNGTITLSESVAGFDYVRIYFSVAGKHASTDVHQPNGKEASLIAVRSASMSDAFHYGGATYRFDGTSLVCVSQGIADSNGGYADSSATYIHRVEGWCEGASIGFGTTTGGGGGGGGEGDLNYTHYQTIASDTWEITHNLGKNPSVTVIDSAGSEVEGDIEYDSVNMLTMTFSGAFSGTAYLN